MDGELRLTLANGFTPSFGDLFTIILNSSTEFTSVVGYGFSNAVMNSDYSDTYPTVFDSNGNPYLLSVSGEGSQFDAIGGNDIVLRAMVP